jgi:hypothetical protein
MRKNGDIWKRKGLGKRRTKKDLARKGKFNKRINSIGIQLNTVGQHQVIS